jgi:CHASE3 domain sensor protein
MSARHDKTEPYGGSLDHWRAQSRIASESAANLATRLDRANRRIESLTHVLILGWLAAITFAVAWGVAR